MERRTFITAMALGIASVLAGCSSKEASAEESTSSSSALADTAEIDKPFSSADQLRGLSTVQLNSVNMLNYLAVVTQQIISSSNNRLVLEDIYSDLVSNVSPEAVDAETLERIEGILNDLMTFRMLEFKRDRLNTTYRRAQAIAANLLSSDPLDFLSDIKPEGSLASARTIVDAVTGIANGESTSVIKDMVSNAASGLITENNLSALSNSVVFMTIESIASYVALSLAERNFLQGGWELDDSEEESIHNCRKGLLSYTVKMVGEYDIPGNLTLTETTANEFAEWQSNDVANRILHFENGSDTFCALGEYWLMLAQSYQERGADGDVEKCIKALETYEEFSTGILRKDHAYAKTLSLALAATEKAKNGSFVEHAENWTQKLLANCPSDDWALRFFAAETYVALARETDDIEYLSLAYETALDNANDLIPKQRELNSKYLAPVETVDGAANLLWSSEEEKELDSYNNLLKEERRTALAPISGPLVLNLELLRAIQLEFPDAVRGSLPEEIILSGGTLFLTTGLDDRYVSPGDTIQHDNSGIEYDKAEVKIPVTFVTSNSSIKSRVTDSEGIAVINDWTLDRVDRGTEDDISTFVAVYKSEEAGSVSYKSGATVTLSIDPWPEKSIPEIQIQFDVVNTKTQFLDNLAVWDDGLRFDPR